jgi:hypothetical protein
MKRGMGMALVLMTAAAASNGVAAAEPPAPRAAAARAAAVPAAAVPPAAQAAAPAKPSQPLDLRIGDVRKYMMPRDFQAVVRARDADADTVVVEGQREVVPMRLVEDVPMGLGSLWYAARDPKNAWRLFAPVVTFKDGPTVDKVPPPVFRWGP